MIWRRKKQIELDLENIPQHIGVIMDGNGRWAKKRGLPRSAGHKRGADILENISDYCNSIGVKALTVYAFSTENWSRPQKEIDALMELLYDYLLQVEEKFKNRNMRLMISGDTKRAIDYWTSELDGRPMKDGAIERMLKGNLDLDEVERWCGLLDQRPIYLGVK